MSIADVQVSDGACNRHLRVSQPHHFLCYHIRIALICKHLMCLQMCGDAQNDVHK